MHSDYAGVSWQCDVTRGSSHSDITVSCFNCQNIALARPKKPDQIRPDQTSKCFLVTQIFAFFFFGIIKRVSERKREGRQISDLIGYCVKVLVMMLVLMIRRGCIFIILFLLSILIER